MLDYQFLGIYDVDVIQLGALAYLYRRKDNNCYGMILGKYDLQVPPDFYNKAYLQNLYPVRQGELSSYVNSDGDYEGSLVLTV